MRVNGENFPMGTRSIRSAETEGNWKKKHAREGEFCNSLSRVLALKSTLQGLRTHRTMGKRGEGRTRRRELVGFKARICQK